MDINELIETIESASEPKRVYDGQLGAFFGWKRIEQDDQQQKVIWLSDKGRPARVPDFSSSIDAIAGLIKSVAANWAVAVTWGPDGKCAASISSDGSLGETGYGSTPALALCSATLKLRRKYRNT